MKLKSIKPYFNLILAVFLTMAQCQNAFAKDIIAWHENSDYKTWHNMPEVKYILEQSGPTLLFSDSPEMVYKPGILYRDIVQGKVRLFFHHVNATSEPKKLAIMLKHNNVRGINYSITKRGVCQPAYNWLKGGKDAEEQYFDLKEQPKPSVKLYYGHSAELLNGNGILLEPNQLVTGIIDLEISKEAEISVLMCEPKSDLELFNQRTKVEPMDEHPLRGTFAKADWNVNVDENLTLAKNEAKILCLANSGHFAKGIDKTTGLPAENYGNYGVVYNVNFEVKGKQKVKFYFAPMGGEFAGYGIFTQKGKTKLVALPQDKTSLGELGEDWLELGQLSQGKYNFTWSPAGSSNLPIALVWEGM